MARRTRTQFQFTMVELTVLAASFAVTSGLVFLLGFYAGREVAAEHAPVSPEVARIPIGATPREERLPARSSDPGMAAALRPQAPAAAPPTAERPAAATEAPVAPEPVEAAPEAPTAPSVPYTVQVLATRNRSEAETLAGNLKKRGFGAFVAAVDDAGGSWYRVRIGRYDDADSARRMAERCHRELGLTQAYVSPVASNVP